MLCKEEIYALPAETPEGVCIIQIQRKVIEENGEARGLTLSATISGKSISFDAESTEDGLILLGKSLPEGFRIKSCISCRHGHFCPVGNRDNELFCIPDLTPRSPADLWFVTENSEERAQRSRTLFDCCAAYEPQSKAYYTYNDYSYRVNP